jgi:hypothetical protein
MPLPGGKDTVQLTVPLPGEVSRQKRYQRRHDARKMRTTDSAMDVRDNAEKIMAALW